MKMTSGALIGRGHVTNDGERSRIRNQYHSRITLVILIIFYIVKNPRIDEKKREVVS